MGIEHADLSRRSAGGMPPQLSSWLREKRMTLAEWNRRQSFTRRHAHDDVRHKRLALVEIELGDRRK